MTPVTDSVTTAPVTDSPVTVTPAIRHKCGNGFGYPHTRGDGLPKRRTCAYCRGRLVTETGTWGVYTWTGTGRYPLRDAIRTFRREKAADEFAMTDETLVVRWTYAG